MPTFKLFWSPEGKHIGTVEAKDASAAKRLAPKPYRKYLGEIYAVQLLVTRCVGIYRVEWWSDGRCVASSQVNGTVIGTWDHGAWYGGAWRDPEDIPSEVKALAMECRPQCESTAQ